MFGITNKPQDLVVKRLAARTLIFRLFTFFPTQCKIIHFVSIIRPYAVVVDDDGEGKGI